jgi:pimeloyl-ACP methyl ester carboxylesterase
MEGIWITPQTNGTAVVFVHGLFSSGAKCWTNSNGAYWPSLLAQDASLGGTGVYVYSYQTDLHSGSYKISDIADDLKERFSEDQLWDANNIVFVCHSMGGLVARRLIVAREADFMAWGGKIGLFLVASPSLGSEWANWLGKLSRAIGHSQAVALQAGEDNAWLHDLDRDFQNLNASRRLSITGKELIEDKPLFFRSLFLRKQLVPPHSAAKYFGEAYKVPGTDHCSIASPADAKAIQHRRLCSFVKDIARTPVKNKIEDAADPVEERISKLPVPADEGELFPQIAQLFTRRAFMPMPERSWRHLFYALTRVRLIWQNEVLRRLRKPRRTMAQNILKELVAMEEMVAFDVLGMEKDEPDMIKHLVKKKGAFLAKLPTFEISHSRGFECEGKREQMLAKIMRQLETNGIPTVHFGGDNLFEQRESESEAPEPFPAFREVKPVTIKMKIDPLRTSIRCLNDPEDSPTKNASSGARNLSEVCSRYAIPDDIMQQLLWGNAIISRDSYERQKRFEDMYFKGLMKPAYRAMNMLARHRNKRSKVDPDIVYVATVDRETKEKFLKRDLLPETTSEWAWLETEYPEGGLALRALLTDWFGLPDPFFNLTFTNSSTQPVTVDKYSVNAEKQGISKAILAGRGDESFYIMLIEQGENTYEFSPPIVVPPKASTTVNVLMRLKSEHPGAKYHIRLSFHPVGANSPVHLDPFSVIFFRGKID